MSYDVAELSPPFDIDYRTAKLAANFIYDIIHHHIPMVGNHHGNPSTT
jgi:arginase family enzyme